MAGHYGGIMRFRERTASTDPSVQEFVPSAAWTEDSLHHLLLIDLPGFKKDEVKLQAEKSGEITISGERLVNDNKYLYFEKTVKAPQNSDVEKVTGKFEGEILYVKVPKQEKEEPLSRSNTEEMIKCNTIVREKQNIFGLGDAIDQNQKDIDDINNQKQEISKKRNSVEGFKKEEIEKWDGQNSMLKKATFMVTKNCHILLTAALAFSLGVFLSRKSHS